MNRTDKNCRNCRFFDKGHCRRYPPAVAQVGEPGRAKWVQRLPVVDEGDYCGEFEGRTPQSRVRAAVSSLRPRGSHEVPVISPQNF